MWVFISILLLSFGIILILAGIFTAYFGSGKSRSIGIGLIAVGVLAGLMVVLMFYYDIGVPNELELWEMIKNALIYIGAAIVGTLIAIGVFLVAIMKS